MRHLLSRVDALLVGGAMANTFLRAAGRDVGDSLVEPGAVEEAAAVAELGRGKLLLPVDAVCARRAAAGEETRAVDLGDVPPGWMILDIGPRTVEAFTASLRGAGTVVWNGPLGVAEIPAFANGTCAVGRAIAECGAYSLVGGGDTAAATWALGLAGRFSHVSTGGGATLECLEGRVLPGVAAIPDAVAAG